MKKKIFISYRHEDVDFARSLRYALKERGFKNVFLDYSNIKDGNYRQVIYQALQKTRILILILSDNTFSKFDNPHDMLRHELESAIELGITIIPINLNHHFKGYPDNIPDHIRRHLDPIQISEIHRGALFESSVITLVNDRIRPNFKTQSQNKFQSYLFKNSKIKYAIISLCFILIIFTSLLIGNSISNTSFSEENGIIPIQMQYIPGGAFAMGIAQEMAYGPHANATPKHWVRIDDYIIGKYEITQAQWEAVMGNNPSEIKGDNLPVTNVSWDDCQLFIAKLNAATGLTYRLPTEAEWEYAALGGDKSISIKAYSGDNNIRNVAWYIENSNHQPHNIGELSPNGYGLYDMSGNVEEWCKDYYDQYTANDSTTISINPIILKWNECRVHRGGNYNSDSQNCHIRNRNMHKHDFKSPRLGVRLALQIPIELSQLNCLQFNKNSFIGQPIESSNFNCIIMDKEIRTSILNHEISHGNKIYCKTNSEETLMWLRSINSLYGLEFSLPTIDEFNLCSNYLDSELINHGVWCYDPDADTIVIVRCGEIITSEPTSRAIIYIRRIRN